MPTRSSSTAASGPPRRSGGFPGSQRCAFSPSITLDQAELDLIMSLNQADMRKIESLRDQLRKAVDGLERVRSQARIKPQAWARGAR